MILSQEMVKQMSSFEYDSLNLIKAKMYEQVIPIVKNLMAFEYEYEQHYKFIPINYERIPY
eukprot:UN11161